MYESLIFTDLPDFRDVKEHIEKIQEERVEEARVKKEKEDKKRKLKVNFLDL